MLASRRSSRAVEAESVVACCCVRSGDRRDDQEISDEQTNGLIRLLRINAFPEHKVSLHSIGTGTRTSASSGSLLALES